MKPRTKSLLKRLEEYTRRSSYYPLLKEVIRGELYYVEFNKHKGRFQKASKLSIYPSSWEVVDLDEGVWEFVPPETIAV